MTRYNIALLSLFASTAFAVPHYGQQHGHKHPVHHKSGPHPSGVLPSGSGGFPTGGPTAPYGTANSTVAPTGSAPVTSSLLSTVTVVPQPEPNTSGIDTSSGTENSPISGASAGGGECGPATITVTAANTNTVTVTVPASSVFVDTSSVESAESSTSAPYANGTTTAPVGTGTAPTYTSPVVPDTSLSVVVNPTSSSSSAVYGSPSVAHPSPLLSSTVDVSPQTASTSSAGGEIYNPPSTTEAVANPTSSSVDSSSEESTSTPSKTPKPPVTPSADNVVPRGLVYNEASLTSHFDNSNVGWLYNWDSAPGGTIDSSKEFVPMLWNTSQVYHVPHWAERAEAAIAAGTKHLLAFNEPDLTDQANMDVSQSVAGWMEYMEPFHTKHNGDVKLGSPSVCNGPEANMGLSYLKSFLDSCGGCHVDFLAIHWYGVATDAGIDHLKEHIAKAQAIADGRAIWLTEFKPDGSDEQQAAFLDKMLPWLDDKSKSGVDRYAYYKVDNLVNGGSLTKAGSAYAA
ncbi:MAG: hypothetical protein L6R40_001459 [Gallowayella cf. fulva]|nr:MAG: hypothetical protein L6R40_001459 [Xanthomendoza cf. fulva]